MRLLNLTLAAGLGLVALSGCADNDAGSASKDIRVTSCVADPAGGKPKAEGTIANSSSKPSAYTFRIRFLDSSGNEVSQATNAVAKVDPGTTSTWRAEGGESAKGTLTCQIDNISRTAVGT